MQTFDQALLGLYQGGRIRLEDALRAASSPHDLKLLIAAEGRTATTMDDLGDAMGEPVAPPAPDLDEEEAAATRALALQGVPAPPGALPAAPGGGRSTPPPVAA
jgi:twitching motility protein PilT